MRMEEWVEGHSDLQSQNLQNPNPGVTPGSGIIFCVPERRDQTQILFTGNDHKAPLICPGQRSSGGQRPGAKSSTLKIPNQQTIRNIPEPDLGLELLGSYSPGRTTGTQTGTDHGWRRQHRRTCRGLKEGSDLLGEPQPEEPGESRRSRTSVFL